MRPGFLSFITMFAFLLAGKYFMNGPLTRGLPPSFTAFLALSSSPVCVFYPTSYPSRLGKWASRKFSKGAPNAARQFYIRMG